MKLFNSQATNQELKAQLEYLSTKDNVTSMDILEMGEIMEELKTRAEIETKLLNPYYLDEESA